MNRLKKFMRKAFIPITIMLVPHNNSKSFNIKVPSIGIILSVALWLTGSIYVLSVAVNALEYRMMKERLGYYTKQFLELRGTMSALKKTEAEFERLFSLGSKEKILENVRAESGSVDMGALGNQVKNAVATVKGIKEYLSQQKDIYMATPKGWPVAGEITSPYGMRENPVHGGDDFHTGIDISAHTGTPVRATADGVVSFSGWSGGSGQLVVIEHGFGFSTLYAHNSKNLVDVGKLVKRGETIALAGSTGNATGPHSHYEIWKKTGRTQTPYLLLKGGDNMFSRNTEKLESLVGSNSQFNGDIKTKGTIRIDGIVTGNIEADWLVMGEKAHIRGDVSARGVIVGGIIEGFVSARELIEIKGKGQVIGDINTPKLAITEGGILEGRSVMKREETNVIELSMKSKS